MLDSWQLASPAGTITANRDRERCRTNAAAGACEVLNVHQHKQEQERAGREGGRRRTFWHEEQGRCSWALDRVHGKITMDIFTRNGARGPEEDAQAGKEGGSTTAGAGASAATGGTVVGDDIT